MEKTYCTVHAIVDDFPLKHFVRQALETDYLRITQLSNDLVLILKENPEGTNITEEEVKEVLRMKDNKTKEKTYNFIVEDDVIPPHNFTQCIALTEEQYRFYQWLCDNNLLNSECDWTEISEIYFEKI